MPRQLHAAKPRTIALVSDSVLPFNKGGKETRIFHLTTAMAALGYDVHVYTMQWWDGGPVYHHGDLTYHAISKRYPLYAGDRRSITQGILFGLACLRLLRADFDVLEVDHMPYFPLFTTKLVALIKRRPMHATWHEVWGRRYWQTYLGPAGLIAAAIERLSVLLPDIIIAVSPHTERQLRAVLHYRGPIKMVANGVDYAHLRRIKPSPEKSDVLYAGRLLSHKNVDMLVAAVARLRTTHPNIRCIIVGDGPEYSRLRQQIGAHGLQDNVVMKGFLADPDAVYALMKSSKVFVLPSTREGFGISVIEAFACGLPVITFDHPDNAARHLISSGSGLVCSPTVTSLAIALSATLAKPAVVPAAESSGFDWSRSARALVEAYGL